MWSLIGWLVSWLDMFKFEQDYLVKFEHEKIGGNGGISKTRCWNNFRAHVSHRIAPRPPNNKYVHFLFQVLPYKWSTHTRFIIFSSSLFISSPTLFRRLCSSSYVLFRQQRNSTVLLSFINLASIKVNRSIDRLELLRNQDNIQSFWAFKINTRIKSTQQQRAANDVFTFLNIQWKKNEP